MKTSEVTNHCTLTVIIVKLWILSWGGHCFGSDSNCPALCCSVVITSNFVNYFWMRSKVVFQKFPTSMTLLKSRRLHSRSATLSLLRLRVALTWKHVASPILYLCETVNNCIKKVFVCTVCMFTFKMRQKNRIEIFIYLKIQ